jgi:hypothetical protein
MLEVFSLYAIVEQSVAPASRITVLPHTVFPCTKLDTLFSCGDHVVFCSLYILYTMTTLGILSFQTV